MANQDKLDKWERKKQKEKRMEPRLFVARAIDDFSFDEIEQALADTLSEEDLAALRVEFEKLHTAYISSRDNEKRLTAKVRMMDTDISSKAKELETLTKTNEENRTAIDSLKQENDKAWRIVENQQEKEITVREAMEQMEVEIRQLKEALEEAESRRPKEDFTFVLPGEDGGVAPTRKAKRDEAGEGGELQAELESAQTQIAEAKENMDKLKDDLYQVQMDLRNRTLELQRERARRAKIEAELADTVRSSDQLRADMAALGKQIESLKTSICSLEQKDKEQQVMMERQGKENEIVNGRLQKTQAELERHITMVDNLQQENMELNNELRLTEDRVHKLNDTCKKLAKAKDTLTKKVKTLTETKVQLKGETEKFKQQIAEITKQLETAHKQAESDAKQCSQMMRERDVATKNYVKQTKLTEKQVALVQLHEQTNKSMGHEIMGFRKEADKQRRIIAQLEKERDRCISENGELMQKLMSKMEDLQLRDMEILDFNKRCEAYETRLKVQQNLYEAVHQDRNTYSHKLTEAQDEMNELMGKQKMLEHQAQQLKDEVAGREAAVIKEHADVVRLEKERDTLVKELGAARTESQEHAHHALLLEAECLNLQKVISNKDQTLTRQRKQLESVITERDILGAQLVRRNDEVSLLYEKCKLQTNMINKGFSMYGERINDIRLLRREIIQLRHTALCREKDLKTMSDYKLELYRHHCQLLHERARCAALENELSHPRQIHRWRGIEITDPTKFELLQKVQALQKKLINRTEEVAEVERVLQEKDRLYLQLRELLERMPSHDVAERMNTFKKALWKRNKQMKGMAAEMNMLETDNKIQNYDIKKLKAEMTDLKKKYMQEKKRCFELHTSRPTEIKHAIVPSLPSERFVGGGFRMADSTNRQGPPNL